MHYDHAVLRPPGRRGRFAPSSSQTRRAALHGSPGNQACSAANSDWGTSLLLHACCFLLIKRFPLSLKVFCSFWGFYFLPDLDVGLEEHEVLPISHRFLAKFDSGMRWWNCSNCSHQELQEEPQLPWISFAPQSGKNAKLIIKRQTAPSILYPGF